MIGQTLGPYRIESKLGQGGRGVVYRAHDETLDRDVALKVLAPETLSDEAARARFRKEALALSRLNQGYNAQAAVEPTMLLIVGQGVTAAAHDKEQGEPMVEAIEQQSGQRPEEILADNGYCPAKNLKYLESAEKPEQKIEGFIATGKQKHGEHRQPCPRGPLPQGATWVDRMKRKLKTKAGAAVYALRQTMVEPVFGQIKQGRGFRQFLLRGLVKVQGEWALVCPTHNI